MKIITIIFISLFSLPTIASSLSLDIGQTESIFNRFAIPNTSEDRISLEAEDKLASYRVTGFFNLSSGNQFYILIAPLETEYNFTSNSNFEFAGNDFSDATETKVNYKFNSYRLGYLWKWRGSRFDFWIGLVCKIRDAEIRVTQGITTSAYDNVGFVPLASMGFELRLFDWLSMFSHTDALGATQGSAYDSQLELKLNLDSFSLSFGKRILGGGADNDKVYNFAQFDTMYSRLSYNF